METEADKQAAAQVERRAVAIVGRPNVGKSAIFNRLAGRRIAIVHAQSGVTRDRLVCEVSWGDARFELIDTGGISNVDGARTRGEIETGIRDQADAAIADATAVVLVVDIESGVHPLDEEVAALLRASGRFVVVAANKADNPGRDDDALEFERLGHTVFPVSALHNRGFAPLVDCVLAALPEGDNASASDPLKVAVVGRPNVGKSSYVNRLLRSDRVIVSDEPGTTRDSIDIPFTVGVGPQAVHYLLIDTAGMRRIGKIKTSVERYSNLRAERSIDRADICVLVLDASCGPTTQDKKIGSRILEGGKGCVVLVNKWDLQERTQRDFGPELMETLPFLAHCPVVFASAETGYNIRRTVEVIDHVAAQVRATLPTATLNRAILDAHERVHPPVIRGKRLKLFYATQIGSAPVEIVLFVNDPSRLQAPYQRYLIKAVRAAFGLEGAPVLLRARARRPPPERKGKPGGRRTKKGTR